MKKKKPDPIQAGRQVGRWTVLDETRQNERGEKMFLCRCACGTERFVLERSLLYGLSQSCGCLRREKSQAVNSYDLRGRRFGALMALEKCGGASQEKGGVKWRCRCDCGRECDVRATLLVTGRRTNCGSPEHKSYAFSDITGRRFRHLVALYPTQRRTEAGSVIWHCRCDCGNEKDISYNELMYSNSQSCGCQKLENNQKLQEHLIHVAGTSVDMLKSKKVPSNSSTGIRGVYRVKSKYVAKIVFQNRQYQLGTYRRIEDAAQARREAEISLNETFVEYYERWRTRADGNPEWAKRNPICATVQRGGDGALHLAFTPQI